MDDLSTSTKEEQQAKEQAHVQLLRITKQIQDYRDNPEAAIEAADVAPHLRNRAR